MKIHRQLTIFTLGFIAISCDPIYTSEIQNWTNENLIVEIYFDNKKMNEIWDGRPIVPYLKRHGLKDGVNIVEFDTINFKTVYQIDPKNSFYLEDGMSRPDYEIYKSVKIISKADTLTLNGRAEIKNTLKQVAKRKWELIVE
jgi:hypothetical protein